MRKLFLLTLSLFLAAIVSQGMNIKDIDDERSREYLLSLEAERMSIEELKESISECDIALKRLHSILVSDNTDLEKMQGAISAYTTISSERAVYAMKLDEKLALKEKELEYIETNSEEVLPFEENGSYFEVKLPDYVEVLEEEVEEEAIPFQLVEEKPTFLGGDANEFSKWVNAHLSYPEIAKEYGVQGRVTLQFTVSSTGEVRDVKVLRGIGGKSNSTYDEVKTEVDLLSSCLSSLETKLNKLSPETDEKRVTAIKDEMDEISGILSGLSLDEEAARVVLSSPLWNPGKQRERCVSVTYTFPVIFQLR